MMTDLYTDVLARVETLVDAEIALRGYSPIESRMVTFGELSDVLGQNATRIITVAVAPNAEEWEPDGDELGTTNITTEIMLGVHIETARTPHLRAMQVADAITSGLHASTSTDGTWQYAVRSVSRGESTQSTARYEITLQAEGRFSND